MPTLRCCSRRRNRKSLVEVRLKPDTTSKDRDGHASPKQRSREGEHNSGTVEPDRGPHLPISL